MKNLKKSYVIIFALVVLSIVCFGASYAIFMNINEQHGKLNIVVGDLTYKIESNDLVNCQITVPANDTKKIIINLSSLNEISSKYELYYTLGQENSDVEVGYDVDTIDSVLGTISAKETKKVTVIIKNNSDIETTIEFSVIGGLVNNELVLTEGNSLNREITLISNFAETILANNTIVTAAPTLTTSSNNTNDASGLYKSTDTNDGSSTYYFRGNVENNYVEFAGQTWRVVRINEDGTVRLIMQDGINSNTTYYFNPTYSNYTYFYYTNSSVNNGAKKILDSWYQINIVDTGYSANIATGDYYCEQSKVKSGSGNTSGSATMTLYSTYTPDFKCSTDGNGKGLVSASIGLITYDEAVYAGGYMTQSNNSYHLYNGVNIWTMSPAGLNTPSGVSTAYVWRITGTGSIGVFGAGVGKCTIRPVINLKADTIVTGIGTSVNPYRIN